VKKMIGRVGRNPCEQLRGLLHTQQLRLEQVESKVPRDENEIAKIKVAIEDTTKKLREKGC
jgi:hypothetical protein